MIMTDTISMDSKHFYIQSCNHCKYWQSTKYNNLNYAFTGKCTNENFMKVYKKEKTADTFCFDGDICKLFEYIHE